MPIKDEDASWHWSEGMKFAIEGIKTMFILNGVATISILTFIGNTKIGSSMLISAMVVFAIGALMAIPTFIFAYLAQLHYGNSSLLNVGTTRDGVWRDGSSHHNCAYVFIVIGVLCFIGGVVFAALGLGASQGIITGQLHT